ncbi:nucleotidyltransferase domain-containing protein [Candidatus Poribacteria bacterium]
MDREELLNRIKDRLEDTYGDRLQGIVLYGSEARGEAEPDSDIDLLVLLKGPVQFGKDLRTNVDVLYDLQLEVIRPIHAVPVDVEVFRAGKYAVYRNAQREGVFV